MKSPLQPPHNLVQVVAGPAGWHRWGLEAADNAQDTFSAWLRAQTGECAAPALRAAGSSCAAHSAPSGHVEPSAQSCAAVSRQRAHDAAAYDDRALQQRWLPQPSNSGTGQSLEPESDWRHDTDDAEVGGQMRPAMFAEKGCTTTMAAEHRHWLRLVRQHLQVSAAKCASRICTCRNDVRAADASASMDVVWLMHTAVVVLKPHRHYALNNLLSQAEHAGADLAYMALSCT